LALCRCGLPDQAQMICRSLYEDVIATHWARLAENRDFVVERVTRQERHWDERFDRALVGRGTTRSPSPNPVSAAEWDRLNKEFGGGTRSWFGSVPKARELVLEKLADDEVAGLIRMLDELQNLDSNMTLHSTVEGLKIAATKPVRYRGRFYFPYSEWL